MLLIILHVWEFKNVQNPNGSFMPHLWFQVIEEIIYSGTYLMIIHLHLRIETLPPGVSVSQSVRDTDHSCLAHCPRKNEDKREGMGESFTRKPACAFPRGPSRACCGKRLGFISSAPVTELHDQWCWSFIKHSVWWKSVGLNALENTHRDTEEIRESRVNAALSWTPC